MAFLYPFKKLSRFLEWKWINGYGLMSMSNTLLKRTTTGFQPNAGQPASLTGRVGFYSTYKVQIRPYLEYAALSWMSCAASQTKKLDRIQRSIYNLKTGKLDSNSALVPYENNRRNKSLVITVSFVIVNIYRDIKFSFILQVLECK